MATHDTKHGTPTQAHHASCSRHVIGRAGSKRWRGTSPVLTAIAAQAKKETQKTINPRTSAAATAVFSATPFSGRAIGRSVYPAQANIVTCPRLPKSSKSRNRKLGSSPRKSTTVHHWCHCNNLKAVVPFCMMILSFARRRTRRTSEKVLRFYYSAPFSGIRMTCAIFTNDIKSSSYNRGARSSAG
jgi:hypothetical protein